MQKRFFGDCSGATLIEYALILAFMTLVAIVGFTAVQNSTKNTYNTVTNSIADSR